MVANIDIPKNTLLCEYAGNVISLQEYHKKDLKNDSNMDLSSDDLRVISTLRNELRC